MKSAATTNAPSSAVNITVAGEPYALPLAIVRDVVSPGVLTRVPHGPRLLLGLMRYRGSIAPLFDLAGLLCRAHPQFDTLLAIVCVSGDRMAAFTVEDVSNISAHGTPQDVVPILDVFSLLDMPHARAA